MTVRRTLHLLILALAAAGPAAAQPPGERRGPGQAAQNFPQARPALGDKALDFVLSDLDGQEVRLADYLGKRPIVIEFGSYT